MDMLYSIAARCVEKSVAGFPQILHRLCALAMVALAMTSCSANTLINS